MIKYAFLKVGVVPAKNAAARATYYSSVKFNIGGHFYSFNDWEHGILRGNAKAPNSHTAPFGKKDPRLQSIVQTPDPRLHFGLNRGTRSCPPVHRFSAEHLPEELDIVAASFCEDDAHVKFDKTKREVHVSKLFGWYRADFTDHEKHLPRLISGYIMKGVKHQSLDRALDDGKGQLKVVFMPYDWSSTNSVGALTFDPEILKNEVRGGIRSLLPISPIRKSRSPQKEISC